MLIGTRPSEYKKVLGWARQGAFCALGHKLERGITMDFYEIIKGSANYLLCALNYYDASGHRLTAKEQLEQYGPLCAVAYAPTKKALVELCKREDLHLIAE